MCGIAGITVPNEVNGQSDQVYAMMQALSRRGPDGEGLERWPTAVLGHRRLSIFDLSDAGRQPMISPDRSVGIVFNGAIYNFRTLRAELESSGYRFTSDTDTEVLIHGYREWGLDQLVQRIRGMFAFALWDDRTGKLFLVRDRLGVKPLIYTLKDGQLAFASTVRALKSAGFVDELDDQAVTEFLEFGYVTDARTIYKNAIKVPAATIVEWSNGNIASRTYWTPPSVSTSPSQSFEDVINETERLFLRAVEMRLHADVPVGALLSGGIDSSLVCWAIAKLGGDIRAFTVGTPGDPWDETADAVATAKSLGISHEVLELSADDAPSANELAAAYGEPFACASALGMLRLSRTISPLAKVLLTGDGGDDVFLGYPEHRHFWMAERLARSIPAPAAGGWNALRGIFPKIGPFRRAASFLDYSTGGLGAVATAHDGLPVYRAHDMLGERLRSATIPQRSLRWSLSSARNLLTEFLEYDRRMRFVGEYMTKVDGATMYYAIEARSPFLDQELWEYAAQLPYDIRLKGGQLKAVLRELAHRKLGDRVARGKKRGFSIPVQRWMVGRWRSRAEELFRDSMLNDAGYIKSSSALRLLENASNSGLAPKQLWYIFVLESWLRYERETKPTPESWQPTPEYSLDSIGGFAQ